MTAPAAPFERVYDLRDLGQAGARVSVALEDADLARLARWAGVEAVESFRATVEIDKLSSTRFRIEAHLESAVVQNCVVTLEPVRSRVVRDFTRELHLVAPSRRAHDEAPEPLTVAAGDDEAPEEIDDLHYDLAGPLLEEFNLGIDPYPRAPGVAFQSVPDGTGAEASPFAVLKSLKER